MQIELVSQPDAIARWQELVDDPELAKLPYRILDYYFATRGAKGRALREVKLIVVGRGGAGKTSLIKRLKGEPFDAHEGVTGATKRRSSNVWR
jgi:GTPase SAR1 family protein